MGLLWWILVGLIAGKENELDPIDDLIRRDAFQRAAVTLGQRTGGMLAGRIGGGIVLLVCDRRGGPRTQQKLTDLGHQAQALGRRFGFIFD